MKKNTTVLLIICMTLAFSNLIAQKSGNSAAVFNGTTSYIAVPNQAELNPTTALTVEAWIYPTNVANWPTVLGKNFATSYWLGFNGAGKLRFYPRGNNNVDGTVSIPVNQWSHVAATYDGAKTRLYLNGTVTDSSTAILGVIGVNTDSLFIGCDRAGSTKNFYFTGSMDNVRIWNVARTPQQIRNTMYTPLNFLYPSGYFTGLCASYQFDYIAGEEYSGSVYNTGYGRNVSLKTLHTHPVNYTSFNNSLVLDGNSYCAIPNHPDMNATTGITLEAWIKKDLTGTQPANNQIVTKSGSSRCDYTMFLQNSSGNLYFQMNNPSLGGTNTVSASAASGITDDAWHHAAVTYNSVNGQATLYVDGSLIGQSTITGNPAIPNNTDSLYVGYGGPYDPGKFKGMLDEVRVWKNVVRTQAEIQAEMFKSRGMSNPSPYSFGANFDDMTNGFKTANGGNAVMYFRGNSQISSAKLQNTYSSPLLFNYYTEDPSGYLKSTKHTSFAAGATVSDSINFSTTNVNVASVKVFVLLSHGKVGNVSVNLISPTGVSVSLLPVQNSSFNGHDIMTIFDMSADSTIKFSNGSTAPFSPMIKPANNLSAFTGLRATGYWKLRITDNSTGSILRVLNGWGIKLTTTVGVERDNTIPGSYSLSQNYPNPFNPSTKIKFSLPKAGHVRIDVYNILGEKIQTLVEKELYAGNHEVMLDASKFASGVYLYKITAGSFQQARKMVLLK